MPMACRIDYMIELVVWCTAPRPMPAVHVNASLGRESYTQTRLLAGGPGQEARLRSVDLESHGREITLRAETIMHP